MSILEARGVSKVFRSGGRGEIRALEDVSVAIASGSFVALAGPSGAGKSTLLAILGLLDRPTRGEVLFQGKAQDRCSDAERTRVRRRLGFVFQSFSLIPRLPLWENVTYPLVPRGVPRGERFALARTHLGRLGLGERLTALPEELSGGEQQRVAVARALAGQPDVLMADEPTSNLDADNAQLLANILGEIHAAGTTLVASTHDPRLLALATVIHELSAGRLKPNSGMPEQG